MWLNIHHRHRYPKPDPVVYYCQHCGHGAKNPGGYSIPGPRVKVDSWSKHWGRSCCPACGASTPPKKW